MVVFCHIVVLRRGGRMSPMNLFCVLVDRTLYIVGIENKAEVGR